MYQYRGLLQQSYVKWEYFQACPKGQKYNAFLPFELAGSTAPESKTMLPRGQEQHPKDCRSRRRRTLEKLLIGMDRRNPEQFEFHGPRKEQALQQKETLMNWFMEMEICHREQKHPLMERLIKLVAEKVWYPPAAEAPEPAHLLQLLPRVLPSWRILLQ